MKNFIDKHFAYLGGIRMNQCNEAIQCTVDNCQHHSEMKNYCTLDKVQIGTHEANPTMDQCTDCKSFMMK